MKKTENQQQTSSKIRLIIPVEFYRKGGVERVIIALLSKFIKFNSVEQIVLILPKKEIDYFKKVLPDSPVFIYESFNLEPKSWENKLISGLSKILRILEHLNNKQLAQLFDNKLNRIKTNLRINKLIEKYNSNHCLYVLTNRLTPPKVKVFLSGISYDLFWRFSLLTYTESYINKYDNALLMWLNQADIMFTISYKTKKDILSVFPDTKFESKLKPVPLAGFPSHDTEWNFDESINNDLPVFYFASSFGIYKDHLTLLKAGLKLAQKNLKFQIILIGRETDSFINGTLELSQQSQTKEYIEYLNQCRAVYQENKNLIHEYFEGRGYCDYEEVEYCYQICSCVVVPSKYEGFGLAVSEAIVRGIPVIASDLEVFKEQVELYQCPDRVEFFPLGDSDALADCMEQFILNPKKKLSSEETKKRFAYWTWEEVAKEYLTLLESLKK